MHLPLICHHCGGECHCQTASEFSKVVHLSLICHHCGGECHCQTASEFSKAVHLPLICHHCGGECHCQTASVHLGTKLIKFQLSLKYTLKKAKVWIRIIYLYKEGHHTVCVGIKMIWIAV